MAVAESVVRTYVGNESSATAWFQRDAESLAASGFFPTTQTWVAGTYSGLAFFFALLLSLVGIGIPLLLYMLIVKPDGRLSVTYEWRDSAPVVAPTPIEKVCPMCAEKVKAEAMICRFCRHDFAQQSAGERQARIQARWGKKA